MAQAKGKVKPDFNLYLMRRLSCLLFVCLFAFGNAGKLQAQTKEMVEMWQNLLDTIKTGFLAPSYVEISEEEILELFDRQPYFGMYRDNYFVTGVPTNRAINRFTADVKFQFSIRHRLTKTVLPFNSFLMLTYTQKSFWDVYADSAPFTESNYNPGLAIAKPVVWKNKLRGMASLAFEHESNGKSGMDNRGHNYFVLTGVYFFNASLSIQGKLWAGWPSPDNKDLYSKYKGYGLVALNYRSVNDKFWISAVVNPRPEPGNFNTQLEFNLKLNSKANQYLFVQWYQGYAESLIDYNRYTSMIRVGICIKPPLRNLY